MGSRDSVVVAFVLKESVTYCHSYIISIGNIFL